MRWQCVVIAWGTKYDVADINALVGAIMENGRAPERFVLLTDRPRPGLHPSMILREIPDYWLNPGYLKGGCQAKLCMFEAGLVPDDLPAIYVDLDTLVFGDLSRLLDLMDRPQTIAILQSAVLPFGTLARFLARRTGGRRYARGNSSLVVYHPAHCAFVAERFRSLAAEVAVIDFRPMWADERFLSWVAQDRMKAVPTRLAVKFPTEFMLPWRWLTLMRASLPWVRRRRDGLIAVTLPGVGFKLEDLARLPEGAELVDRKGRRLIWSDRALGSVHGKIIAAAARLATSRAVE